VRLDVKVQDDAGRARVLVLDGTKVLGMINVPWGDYAEISRRLFTFVLNITFDVVNKRLGDMLWTHAQLVSDHSAELAKKRLADLEFTTKTIERFSEELSKSIVEALIERMPAHE
jgi:hypothetical protein